MGGVGGGGEEEVVRGGYGFGGGGNVYDFVRLGWLRRIWMLPS